MGLNTTKSDSVTRVLVRKEKLNFRKINGDHLTTEHENVKNVPNESFKKSLTLFKFNSILYIYIYYNCLVIVGDVVGTNTTFISSHIIFN